MSPTRAPEPLGQGQPEEHVTAPVLGETGTAGFLQAAPAGSSCGKLGGGGAAITSTAHPPLGRTQGGDSAATWNHSG